MRCTADELSSGGVLTTEHCEGQMRTKYLYCVEDISRKVIKVGLSVRPRERILALRHDVPSLNLWFNESGFLWICLATQEQENRVHRQLDAFRIHERPGCGRTP